MRGLHSQAPSRRLGRASLGAIVLTAAIASSACPAQGLPPAQQLLASIRSLDTTSLAGIARGPAREAETQVAQGILAAFQGSDGNAVQMLQATGASSDIPAELRFEAWRMLAEVHRRNGRFADAVSAWDAGLALGVKQDALEAQSIADAVANDRALSAVPQMRGEVSRSAEVPIERNELRLPQSLLFVNGQGVQAVLDPGAASSMIADSVARRLGLRMLDSTGQAAPSGNFQARFAIADTLKFAGADFREALFTVLTDDALTFADGNGSVKIEAILGLPVMRRLGRLEFVITEDGERLRRRSGRASYRASSNMILAGTQPVALVNVEGQATPLRLALDSSSIRSSLTRLGASEFPALMATAIQQPNRTPGGGGSTQVIPRMVLQLGEENVRVMNVPVAGGPACCHGVIGQDVLRSRAGYIIDFDAMRLELVPLSGGASPRNLRGR